MADIPRNGRPLSPHLQIYRPQLNSITSIMTRLTGNALLVGMLLVTWWLIAAATGPDAYAAANGVLTSWFGDLVMLGSLWALWYHALAGLRHLYWDNGGDFSVEFADVMGWAIIAGSVLLTVLTVIAI